MSVTSGIGRCDMSIFHCPSLQILVNGAPLYISTGYYTGLLKMIVGVLTNCHTQYT